MCWVASPHAKKLLLRSPDPPRERTDLNLGIAPLDKQCPAICAGGVRICEKEATAHRDPGGAQLSLRHRTCLGDRGARALCSLAETTGSWVACARGALSRFPGSRNQGKETKETKPANVITSVFPIFGKEKNGGRVRGWRKTKLVMHIHAYTTQHIITSVQTRSREVGLCGLTPHEFLPVAFQMKDGASRKPQGIVFPKVPARPSFPRARTVGLSTLPEPPPHPARVGRRGNLPRPSLAAREYVEECAPSQRRPQHSVMTLARG